VGHKKKHLILPENKLSY